MPQFRARRSEPGLGLALVADFRVAAPEARFAANFVKLGFHPGFGITHTLPRLIGEQKCRADVPDRPPDQGGGSLCLGPCRRSSAASRNCAARRCRLAREIAENAPLAVQSTRATLRKELAAAVQAQTDHEFVEQTALRATKDFAEGVRAVAERRAGRFTGT